MDEWFADEGSDLPEDLAVLIKPELAPGERLLWASKSRPREGWRVPVYVGFGGYGFGGALVSALAFAALFNLLGPWYKHVETFLAAVAVVGLLVAIITAVVFVQFLTGVWLRGRSPHRTSFALTDRRAIFWRPDPNSSALEVFSYAAETLRNVHRREHPDGSGDVCFSPTLSFAALSPPPTGFEGVAQVRRVEELVREMLLVAGPPPTSPAPPDQPVRGPRRWSQSHEEPPRSDALPGQD